MAVRPQLLLAHLRRLLSPPREEASGDAELLTRFVRHSDEEAFASLVRRHGGMVQAVCRRVLHDAHAAEDAAQAVWLVLARKAATLRRPQALAAYLHGVARQVALNARRAEQRRQQREARAAHPMPTPSPDPLEQLTARELLLVLDEEIQRLPERYRLPVVLCALEGRTAEEAAELLGWTVGSVRGRLARGRSRLEARLMQRGLALSAALLALEASRLTAAGPTAMTMQAALGFAASRGAGPVAAPVASLAESALRSAGLLKVVSALVLATAGLLVAGTLRTHPPAMSPEAHAAPRKAEAPATEEKRAGAAVDFQGDPLPPGAVAHLGDGWLRHPSLVTAAAFAQDGKSLVTASETFLYQWDLVKCTYRRFFVKGDPVEVLCFSRDGKVLFAGCWRSPIIHVLDATQGFQERFSLKDDRASYLQKLWPSEDGKTLMAWPLRGGLLVWDLERHRVRRFLEGGASRPALAPDGKWLVWARENGSLQVVDTSTGKEMRTLPAPPLEPKAPKILYKDRLVISPDGRSLAIRRDNSMAVVSVARGKPRWQLKPAFSSFAGPAYSPNGKSLAWGKDQHIILYDADSGKEQRRLAVPSGCGRLMFAPDGRQLAVTAGAGVSLLDVRTGKSVRAAVGHSEEVRSLFFLPDGKRLVSAASPAEIILWDIATGREIERRPWSRLWYELSLDAEGKTLRVVDPEGFLYSWPATAGARIVRRNLALPRILLTLSPDGKTVAGAEATVDQAMFLQDLDERRKRRALEAPRSYHNQLVFAGHGKTIVGANG
jgi:RNA polymerase sigma factor (sigma-70 family)